MITSKEVREKYLKFFEKRGHKRITPSPIVPENDPTTLFTGSGMQQLIPNLMGETHPLGKRLTDSQPLLRAHGLNSDDTDEVGDNRHLTFLEMLGNWSLGDYFKKEQLSWIYEFLTSEKEGLGLDSNKLNVSVFDGNEFFPRDEETFKIWKEIGIPEDRIFFYGEDKNWWSRSGIPAQMPVGEIGGPDSEIFYDFGKNLNLHENSIWKDEKCHPNCDCGRFVEICNSVFMQYIKKSDKKFENLPQRNVDFGGGLERLTATTYGVADVFRTDLFWEMIEEIQDLTGKKYGDNQIVDKKIRVIADHTRSAVMLIASDIYPSNKLQGYVLRKLIRRIALKMRDLKGDIDSKYFIPLLNNVIDKFEGLYIKAEQRKQIVKVFTEEIDKFKITLDKGLKELSKLNKIEAKEAFNLYQTYGFPLELTVELLSEKGQTVDKEAFKKEFQKHQEVSRTSAVGIFKGGLADHLEETTRLHTATHLLHASLRKILGDSVSQKGSHITKDRLRFDFSYPEKLSEKQVKEVIDLMNKKIKEDLPVTFIETSPEAAIVQGALHFFAEKYGEKVKMYTIGSNDDYFSREICGGPHVTSTGLVGDVRMIKQEKIGSGIIRIYVGFLKENK